jgi:hypothetical protein
MIKIPDSTHLSNPLRSLKFQFEGGKSAMTEKDKYRAKIEAQMTSFNESIEEILTKAKLKKATQPDIEVRSLLKKHEDAKAKLKELVKSDDNSWQKIKTEMDQLITGVDEDLRRAMAYFG